jgi:hypothetical protein
MKEKFAKLINVKTMVTLGMTGTFIYLSATKEINAQQFIGLFTMVIGFYFGTQSEKNKGGE